MINIRKEKSMDNSKLELLKQKIQKLLPPFQPRYQPKSAAISKTAAPVRSATSDAF